MPLPLRNVGLQIFFLCHEQPANWFWKVVEAISIIRLVRLGHILPDVQELLLVAVSQLHPRAANWRPAYFCAREMLSVFARFYRVNNAKTCCIQRRPCVVD